MKCICNMKYILIIWLVMENEVKGGISMIKLTQDDLKWPRSINFDTILKFTTGFPFEWYVTWPILTIFKFLTTLDHSLVISGRSKPSPTNSPYPITYKNCPHVASKPIGNDFGNFDRKSKSIPNTIFSIEFRKNFFCNRFLRVWRRPLRVDHN